MTKSLDPELRLLAKGASALLAWLSIELQTRSSEYDVERVLFMTREGALLQAYFEAFVGAGGTATTTIPAAELLRVSRLSTFAASLHGQGSAGLERLFNAYPMAKWAHLLASLGEPEGSLPSLPGCGAELRRLISADAVTSDWLASTAARKHAELSAYMQAHHREAMRAGRMLVVDIGWRGTIQDNLALAFPRLSWNGMYLGLHEFRDPQPPNTEKHGLLFEPGRPGSGAAANLMPIEYLFHQSVGSVAGYRDGGVLTLPSRMEDPISGAFQAAVLADAPRRAGDWIGGDTAVTRLEWQEEARAFWDGCQNMPLALFRALCGYAHEETFGLGRVINLARAISPSAALRSLVSRQDRALFLQYVASLPLNWRHESSISPWLRGWLHLRHWLHTRART